MTTMSIMRWLSKEHGGNKKKIIDVDAQLSCKVSFCRHALHYHTTFWYFVWFSWPLHVFPIPFLPHFGLACCRVVPVRLLPAQPPIFHPQSSQSFPRRWRRRNEESCWSDLALAKWNAWCVAWWQKILQIVFLFQRDFFFLDLVRWESSLKAFVQRCYKKSCSLRFNNVFFKICTSNFWRNPSIPEVPMWWPVVSTSRRWRPWWITPLRRIFKRISIVWGARHAPGRPGDTISMPQQLGIKWVKVDVLHMERSNIFCCKTSELLICCLHLSLSLCLIVFVVVCFSKIQRMSMSQLLHMHHFCYHWAGGAYIYLRDTWWFGPFWEDASWERWLLGAYQTLRQSIQESDLESLGSRINLRHCHHLFLKKPLQKLRKISDPQRGTKSKEVLVDTSLESFGSVP